MNHINNKALNTDTQSFIYQMSKSVARFATIIIVMTIAITFVLIIGNEIVERRLKAHGEYAKVHMELINLLAITQEMRRREKDFFLRKDIIYATKYDNLSAEAMSHITEVKKLDAAKRFDGELSKLNDLLQKHNQQFVKSVLIQQSIGLDLDKGIQGKMRDYIHHLEDILVYQIKDKQLTILLFTLRRNEKNFLLKMQSAPDQPTPEVAEEFKEYIENLKINHELKAEVKLWLNKYLDEFRALVEQELALRKSSESLTVIFTEFEALHYTLLKQSRTLTEKAYSNVIVAQYILKVSIGVLALLLALIVGIYGTLIIKRASRFRS